MSNKWDQYAVADSPAVSKWDKYASTGDSNPQGESGDDFGQGLPKSRRKGFFESMGAEMTPDMKSKHPILSGVETGLQNIATGGERLVNAASFGILNKNLEKNNIKPPEFEGFAPQDKSVLNLATDLGGMSEANKVIGMGVSKVVAPVAKSIAKSVPEGLKQSSYALMQSIIGQLPKEFKYGANAGRAMVKEGFSGDASAIKEQVDKRIEEIGSQGDALASASTKPVNNSNAMKVIEDKISELKKKSPRTSAGTIKKLQDSRDDLLGVKEGVDKNGNKIILDKGKNVSKMTAKDTLDLKRDFDEHTAWKGTASDDTVFNKTMQQARTKLKENLNDAAPGMKEWNQRYADLRAAQQAAERRITQDKAGAGLSNIINNAVRGTVGITTLGAALTGHGAAAGEILAGWGAKEVLGNPMIKSKLAQALYGLSEADKAAIFKSIPWAKRSLTEAMDKFRQKPNPRGESVDAELVDNRPKGIGVDKSIKRSDRLLPSDAKRGTGPVIKQGGPGQTKIGQEKRLALPRPVQVKGKGFVMNNPSKGQVISNEEAGRNPMDEDNSGVILHKTDIQRAKEMAQIDQETKQAIKKSANGFLKDIKGKIKSEYGHKGHFMYGEFSELKNSSPEMFSPKGMEPGIFASEIARKYPEMFNYKDPEKVLPEDLVQAYFMAKKLKGGK